MTDNYPTFDIFGAPSKDDIRVGYISTDRGYVSGLSICEANDYAKLNPGTIFILKNRKEIRYIGINSVNELTVDDLYKETGDECGGIQLTVPSDESQCKPQLDFFGGGGIGALGNPVVGRDGSILAIDLETGGFGYTYTPAARIKDPCGIGAGAELRVEMVEDSVSQLIEYDDEEDFEEYEICDKNDVGFGRNYDVKGKDIGEWNPNLYFGGGTLSFDEELKKYSDFLLKKTNPWWTTRTENPLKTTSDGVISRSRYDVYHWAWGATPNPEGTGTIIGDLYLELLGRKPDSGGFKYWQGLLDSGKSVGEIRQGIIDSEEFKNNELNGTKAVVAEDAFVGGAFYKVDKNNFMNKYAISPVPMSNVIPSDFGGKEHYFEWEIEFPYEGDYKFRFQCDNQGSLYIDGQKKAEYKLGSGGAGGNVLSPPESTVVGISSAGFHTVRVDIFNGSMMKKLAEQNDGLGELSTSDEVKFDVQVATMYGASATIEGLDISFAKTYGIGKDISESITKKVEYGRVYDVKITSDNKRTGNLPATNKALIIDGKGVEAVNRRRPNPKRLEFDDNGDNGFDINATFTIDSGNATFAEDGLSVKGTGEQTITLWWNDRRRSGRAINSIKLGSTEWKRTGSGGSVTRTLTLGGGVGQLGGDNNKAVLRTKGAKVIQMEDIPHDVSAGSGGTGNESDLYNDVIIAVDQGRFFDINGLTAKYTLGDRPAESGVSSTESAGEVTTIFNTADYIDKASRPLWRTNPVVDKDSSFTNRYGITPKDPNLIYSGAEEGTHEIQWHNVNFPVSGEYDIGIGVDDNVTLRIGGDVNIYKQGFVPGTSTSTGTSLYRRFITAGNYTVIAVLEQTAGGRLGYRNIAGDAAGRNPMSLSINIDTVFTQRDIEAAKSWNQNPFGVALAIEAPDPPVPQEPKPVKEGRCPPNPFWSTRFPNAEEQWYPFSDNRKIYRYGMSPVKPYGDDSTSGGGQTYSNTWNIDAPYDGFYKLKVAADDSAVIKLDGNEVLRTEGLSTQSTQMVGIDSGPHQITVDVSNVAQETFDSIDQRVFTTQGWSAIGTQVEQALNTNEVDFKFSTSTLYGATASIDGLGISIEKTYGNDNVSETFSKKVEFDKVYDVKLTSNTIRSENSTTTIGGSYPLAYTKLKAGNPRRASNRRLEYDDNPGNGFDVNAAFTIDNVTGGTAKFSADGSSIEVQGDEVKVTLTYNWNDNPRRSGRALETIQIKDTVWRQLNWRARENRWVVESVGSHTYTVTLAGKTTSTTSKKLGGANNGAALRTKGDTVLQMEDIPNTDAGGGGVGQYWDDVIISASQGRFYDINGLNAKYVLEKETKTVMQGGVGSGTVKDGVVYSGPELYHKNYSGWGSFMNKSSVSQNPLVANAQVVNYTWSNIDFPEDGMYQVKFQNDAHATLYLDGEAIVTGNFDNEAGVSAQDESNWSGSGKYKNVPVNKGKHTLTVGPSNPDLIDTLFKQPAGYKWHENPSGFAIEIRKKMKVVRTDATGKPVTKSWKENPVLVSAHLIPPPCPKLVEGIGVVKDVIPIVPGNGYIPPSDPDESTSYPVVLELTNVLPEDGGINYDPEDEVVITGGPGDPVIPPFKPKLGPFGAIIDIPVPPTDGGGGVGGWTGFTQWPDISITTSTGTGFKGTPIITVRRTPPLVDPDRLLQVTDLVGLKQTGYYDGKPYYGAIFYKEGIKYAGWYETAGQLVQVYDTLQESIDAMVTTPPSAIQRQGSDIRSNDPRLNIPNTPDNLTY
jgi:hypothetical protein